MHLSLTWYHRGADGAEVGRLVGRIADLIADPNFLSGLALGKGAMLVHVTLHSSLWVVKSGEQPSQVDLALSEGTTAATLLTSLTRQPNVVMVINDRAVSDLATPLKDGDHILLLAPISGG